MSENGKNGNKVAEIVALLSNAILSGDLAPGTALRQEQLSEELGVSRTPIREALRELVSLGLVSIEPNRGARVREPSVTELHETFMVRAELEGLAAELALDKLTKADLKAMEMSERRFAELTELLKQGPGTSNLSRVVADWFVANESFHDIFVGAAKAPLIMRLVTGLRHSYHGAGVWSTNPRVHELWELNVEQHRAIRLAFVDRDPGVRQLVVKHVHNSGELYELILSSSRNRLLFAKSGGDS